MKQIRRTVIKQWFRRWNFVLRLNVCSTTPGFRTYTFIHACTCIHTYYSNILSIHSVTEDIRLLLGMIANFDYQSDWIWNQLKKSFWALVTAQIKGNWRKKLLLSFCFPSLLQARSSVLLGQHPSLISELASELPTQTEDQLLSRSPPGLQRQSGTAQIFKCTASGFSAFPVWDSHFWITWMVL